MKLLRIGEYGKERPAIIDSKGSIRDLSGLFPDFTNEHLSINGINALMTIDNNKLPKINGKHRIGCPIPKIGKIICVGLNYREHARETGAKIPSEPVLFLKATSSIMGANDKIVIPKGSKKTDWEVELAVIIGTTAKYVSEKDALNYVAGYAVINDLSEREFQLERGGQWDKGKGCDTFSPIGPWLVTKDEIKNPNKLQIWLDVNGKRMQNSNTSDMIFKIANLISYISQFMSLYPGDIISTGTPPGVGLGQSPTPRYLKSGDKVRLGIEGLGEQLQVCCKY